MPTPEEYRKTAEAYYRLALEAKTEADRLALLKLAEHWLEAASREDNKTSEQAAVGAETHFVGCPLWVINGH
jgi:hypothetical protein